MPLEWKFATSMPMSLQYDILEFQNYLIFLLILSLSFFECPLLQLIFKLWNYFSVIYSIVECFYGAFYLIYYIFNFHRFHLAFLQSLLNSSFISFIYFLILFGYFLDACMFKCVLLGLIQNWFSKFDLLGLIFITYFLLFWVTSNSFSLEAITVELVTFQWVMLLCVFMIFL